VLFLALDSYAKFGALDLLVPFASWYRPVWTGLGIIAAYLALAVYAASTFDRNRLSNVARLSLRIVRVFGAGSVTDLAGRMRRCLSKRDLRRRDGAVP
jgi:hypothetical protein